MLLFRIVTNRFLRNEERALNGVRFHDLFPPKRYLRVHYEWLHFYYDLNALIRFEGGFGCHWR